VVPSTGIEPTFYP